mmetsp:Transcript_26601/g.74294  ORF Transcript_26601/g.74294 Transcript_26601/m.74294 type:complete len:270 (+) Transcript_26601:81-890(+)
MHKIHSSLLVSKPGSGEFNGVLTWVTPSALFCVSAASRSLSAALSTPVARLYCKEMCSLKPESWVYIDDLTSLAYNRKYAQVLGPQGGSDLKVKRCGCTVYGVKGKKVHDRVVHQQMFRTVSLSVRNFFKVQTTVAAVRIYADDEPHSADAVQVDGLWFEFSYVSNVRIPAGLLGCIKQAQKCPTMKDTSMPLILQDVEMLSPERPAHTACISLEDASSLPRLGWRCPRQVLDGPCRSTSGIPGRWCEFLHAGHAVCTRFHEVLCSPGS